MDALYFRVSSERQTTENQFEDLLQIAERDDSGRDWITIRKLLANCVIEEQRPGPVPRILFRVDPAIATQLVEQCIYVEQGKSSRVGARPRPLFQQMKKDAAQRKFDRLLVWKVARLGRKMREVIDTVYELCDLGITVYPVKSETGPIDSRMGKLLWPIQAWLAEIENDERAEAVLAGQARAKAEGKKIGRPRVIFPREEVVRLRDEEKLSWSKIAVRLGVSSGTVRRAYRSLTDPATGCQKYASEAA